MKLNEARERVGYYLSLNSDVFADWTNLEGVEEKLKEACRMLDDRSLIEKVDQLTKKIRAFLAEKSSNATV